MTKLKVMVVDDDLLALEVAAERLRGAGYDVVLRSEALGTTRAVRAAAPDVILLDLSMPALNGEKLVELLAKDAATERVTVVLHSSMSGQALLDVMKQTGAHAAISKTSSDSEFIRLFNGAVTSSRGLRVRDSRP